MVFMSWGSSILITPKTSMLESGSRVIIPMVVLWVANREKPVTDSAAMEVFCYLMENMALCDPVEKLLHLTGNLIVLDNISGNTLWQSFDNPGDTQAFTPQVQSQAFTMKGSAPYWRSSPWAKTRFTGIPIMDETFTNPFSLQQDSNGSGFISYLNRNFMA
ncbi:G-type lectin S-receptor-like serine/threonine-protein kinase [Cardamine amara subsp. amara]|uniref:G-type lectin S-receptor-like serine/threonine-protein kinase n=1 Tax=Cardamine amara subsp. amara TaxID=228776 RepID=A0ABD0ZAE3_CARAN